MQRLRKTVSAETVSPHVRSIQIDRAVEIPRARPPCLWEKSPIILAAGCEGQWQLENNQKDE